MSKVHIRLANLNDAADIAEVHTQSWQVAYRGMIPQNILDQVSVSERTANWQRRLRDTSNTVILLEIDKRVAGFINFGVTRDEDSNPKTSAEIYAIYLEPMIWGEGYGKQLCQAAFDYLQKSRYQEVTLWTMPQNKKASEFFERLGFLPTGNNKIRQIAEGCSLQEIRYRKPIKADEIKQTIDVSMNDKMVDGLPFTPEEKALSHLLRENQASQLGGKNPPITKFNVTERGVESQKTWLAHPELNGPQHDGAASPPRDSERARQNQEQEAESRNDPNYDYRLRHTAANTAAPTSAPRPRPN